MERRYIGIRDFSGGLVGLESAMTKPDYNKFATAQTLTAFFLAMSVLAIAASVLVSNLITSEVANAELRKDNEMLADKLEIADRVCRARFTHPVEPKPVKRKRR